MTRSFESAIQRNMIETPRLRACAPDLWPGPRSRAGPALQRPGAPGAEEPADATGTGGGRGLGPAADVDQVPMVGSDAWNVWEYLWSWEWEAGFAARDMRVDDRVQGNMMNTGWSGIETGASRNSGGSAWVQQLRQALWSESDASTARLRLPRNCSM